MHFELQKEFDGLVAKITWVDEKKKNLLPLDLVEIDLKLISLQQLFIE